MRRERRHHAAPKLRARAAGRREAEGAHAGGLLRVPPPVEPQRERLGLRDLPIEPQERDGVVGRALVREPMDLRDRKSTRLNSSHSQISYAVFCLKKKITPNIAIKRPLEPISAIGCFTRVCPFSPGFPEFILSGLGRMRLFFFPFRQSALSTLWP